MLVLVGLGLFCLALYLLASSGALDDLLTDLLALVVGNSTAANGTETNGKLANATAQLAAKVADISDTFIQLVPDELTELSASANAENPELYAVAGWATLVVSVIYLIALCLARKKIGVAVALIKEASGVLRDRPLSLLFPFVVLSIQIPLCTFLVVGLLFLGTAQLELAHFTSTDALTAHFSFLEALGALNTTLAAAEEGPWVQYVAYLYFCLGVLWMLFTAQNIGWTALSGSCSDWYFFRRDPQQSTSFPLCASLYRVLRYHLGTILFGSFIMAAIRLCRIVLEIVDRQTKKLQESNNLAKLTIKCVKCCLWCFEKTVKFITDYCYIYVAMQGSSFCKSCWATFQLIMGQPAQLALNTFVRLVLGLIQTLGITCACAWLTHTWLTREGKSEPIYATAVAAVAAYVIASSFALVFSCVLDTLFVCCVRDKAEYKAAFMSDRLHLAFGFDKSDRKEQKAAKKDAKKQAAADSEGGAGGGEGEEEGAADEG